jgi:hypothetical protein
MGVAWVTRHPTSAGVRHGARTRPFRGMMATVTRRDVLRALGLAMLAGPPHGIHAFQEPRPMADRHATGTFTVKTRAPEPRSADAFVRLELDKTFEGGLQGTSTVEMLASNAGDQPSGGYVALERFTGTLDGRQGSFVLQHSGTMEPGRMHIDVLVTPGSGTGQLAGIGGRLTIRMDGRQHFYDLAYRLP